MSTEPDLETLPDLELPEQLPDDAEVDLTELPVFDVCLRFNGRPWQSLKVSAPSPEDVAVIMDNFAARINAILVQRRYPPGMCTWTHNACF
ncbi:hypothetical protein [Nonomuraea sediminis]|uniref:hypothetical protein n=1 Tax=Nonomuraea sediminis TaxID=2835864 RepID=UPI001BDD0FCD|nr:hypothetical protein [Nonomuraea sediminis]